MDVENGKTVYQKLHIKPKEKEQPTEMIHIIDVIKHWKTSLRSWSTFRISKK